jgi:pimeloyl-ACP methyl ester carboxylesterase
VTTIEEAAMPYARHGDVEIFYETFGDARDPALMLVNGLGTQCINYRSEWCEKFAAEGFRVIRFDNRDVGLSTKFASYEPNLGPVVSALAAGKQPEVPYTLSDMAGDAVAVLDHLGIDRAHVVGSSMGGMIVQTMAIEHPDRLLSMTSVMSTTGDPDVGRPSPAARRLFTAPPPTDATLMSPVISTACASGAARPASTRSGSPRMRPRPTTAASSRPARPARRWRSWDRRAAPTRCRDYGCPRSYCTATPTSWWTRAADAVPPMPCPGRASWSSRAWATTTRRSTGTGGFSL